MTKISERESDISNLLSKTNNEYFRIHQTFSGQEAQELIKQAQRMNEQKYEDEEYTSSKINEPIDYNKQNFMENTQTIKDYFEEGKRKYPHLNHAPTSQINTKGIDDIVYKNLPQNDKITENTNKINPSNSNIPKENYFTNTFKNYETTNHAQELKKYLTNKGREFYDLEGITTKELQEGAVAGIASYGNKAVLVGSNGFEQKVNNLAKRYQISKDVAERYVFDHETVHLSQKGKNLQEKAAEYDVENTLKTFYTEMAKKQGPNSRMYESLAKLAGIRINEVPTNYSGSSAGKNYKNNYSTGKGNIRIGNIGNPRSAGNIGSISGSYGKSSSYAA